MSRNDEKTTAGRTGRESGETKKRVAVVGIGHRAASWIDAAMDTHAEHVRVVGLCDRQLQRAEDAISHWSIEGCRAFAEIDDLLESTRPDLVVVCVPEAMHAQVICRALDAGCEVATEKPLCTTVQDAKRILDAERRAGRPILMGFNYRHIPLCREVRRLIQSGAIGMPVSADLNWTLDYRGHGGSYFRRWHSDMATSGGLLITKATHHFDLMNWWMDDTPVSVFARAKRRFFGPEHSPFGDDHAARCRDCHQAEHCDFHRPTVSAAQRSQELGYRVRDVRDYEGDLCVYRPEIDIADTHSVCVEYRNGALLNYSLNAAAPFEGWTLAINGTNGRLETQITDAKPRPGWQRDLVILRRDHSIVKLDPAEHFVADWPAEYTVHVMPHDAVAYQTRVPNVTGGHGGGDAKIIAGFYRPDGADQRRQDPLGTFADATAGAYSMAVGDAANRSAQSGEPITIPQF